MCKKSFFEKTNISNSNPDDIMIQESKQNHFAAEVSVFFWGGGMKKEKSQIKNLKEKVKIPSTNRATNANGKSSLIEISAENRRSSSAEIAWRVNGFVRVWRQSIMAMIHPSV